MAGEVFAKNPYTTLNCEGCGVDRNGWQADCPLSKIVF